MTNPDPGDKAATSSLGALLSGVSQDISTLFRQEVALAKAELTESAKSAGKGAGMLGGAGVTALFAVLFLSIAAWWGLGYLIGNALSAIVVAIVYAIAAAVLFVSGRKNMKRVKGAPQTVESLKRIPETMKPGGTQ